MLIEYTCELHIHQTHKVQGANLIRIMTVLKVLLDSLHILFFHGDTHVLLECRCEFLCRQALVLVPIVSVEKFRDLDVELPDLCHQRLDDVLDGALESGALFMHISAKPIDEVLQSDLLADTCHSNRLEVAEKGAYFVVHRLGHVLLD